MSTLINHALVLNLHQPSGNLEYLLENQQWEAKEILWAMDRIPRSLWGYEDIAKVHLSLSGTLLETLINPDFQEKVYGITKVGDLLWFLQNTNLFHILGTGYYHPVFPLTPENDWKEQCTRWLGIGKHVFWRSSFSGFWPPEMGFCMEMIPLLKNLGYRYVLVDSKYIEPLEKMSWEEIHYQPHFAKFGDDEIIVIVRDRELSDAQEAGMDWGWFSYEVNQRTKFCNFVPLVTTCTDGENGGWFRNTNEKSNFWQYFYKEFMNKARAGLCNIKPVFIDNYLDTHGAHGYVNVKTGAWNTGWHHGEGFIQWTGSQEQKNTLDRIKKVSDKFHQLSDSNNKIDKNDLEEAYWRILRSETSCNVFWGEAWVHRCHQDLDLAEELIDSAIHNVSIS